MKEFAIACLILGFGFIFVAIWVTAIWLPALLTGLLFILAAASILGSPAGKR